MPFRLNDYTDITELAKGGMGKIYLATQVSLNRKVVIKEMAGGLLTTKNEIKRFENEAQAGAALNHDNIIRIYDFGEEKGSFYIAMEFIDGPDLDQLLKQNDFPREIGMMVLHQALKGIAYAHERGIVHRDVKPANMLISSHGTVKMVDFGLSYAGTQSGQLTTTGAIVGTPPYMSPELVSGEETRNKCMDIWAAGVILYRLVTGDFPFTGDNVPTTLISIMQNKEKPAEEMDGTLPPRLAELLHSCLTKDHAKRLPDLSPLIEALQNHFFDIGIRDPVDTIRKFLADRTGAMTEIRSHLVRYHLAKGKEYSKTMQYSTAQAHFRAAKKFDPKNKEILSSLRSLDDYMGSVLAGATATVEKEVVTKVRASRREKKAKGAPVFLAALVLLSLVALAAVAVALYKPVLWEEISGEVKTVAGVAYRAAQQAIVSIREKGRLTAPVTQPDLRRKVRDLAPSVKSPADDQSSVDNRRSQEVGGAADSGMASIRSPGSAAGPTTGTGNDSGAAPPKVPGASAAPGTVLANGGHRFQATADGIAPSTASVAVSGSDTHHVMIGLAKEKKTGELEILSDISAELYIDGEFKGKTPTASPFTLLEGDHTVMFKRQGYKPYEKTVVIRSGEIKQIKISR